MVASSCAVYEGYKEIAELLIANGADVNAKSRGRTPLLGAATKEIAELLIENGADLEAKNNAGWTPLHDATRSHPNHRTPSGVAYRCKGHKEFVELLIAKGANVNAKAKGDATPLDYAGTNHFEPLEVKAARKEIADLLRKHGGRTSEELALMPRLVQHGRFAFSFDAKEGKVYEVQDSFDLLNWEVIKTYTGTGDSVRFDEERDHDPPQWFYRVRVVE